MTREGIEKKIQSILRNMKLLKIQYSDYEDQLSDLRSDLSRVERKSDASERREEEE